jgi:hypothetical protein
MRRPLKFRLSYFAILAMTYFAGFQFIPEQIDSTLKFSIFVLFLVCYFLVIPSLYWFWVIKIGKQKLWKLIIPFSMGGLIARFSFPTDIAQYFEFIMWAKYPIIAVVFALEIFVIYSVIKALWQARKLSGDPRVNIVSRFEKKEDDEKKLTIALMLAYEPSSWYYFISHFSRNHPTAIGQLNLLSAKRWHLLLLLTLLVMLAALGYGLVVDYSQFGAILLAGFVLYGVVVLSANHKVSRYYSLYLHNNQLVINNSMWGLMVIPLKHISKPEVGHWAKTGQVDALQFGCGEHSNIKLNLTPASNYYSNMGQAKEMASEVYLQVENPETFQAMLVESAGAQ